MTMVLDYELTITLHHNHQEVDACALEIAEYVGNHTNWYKPILPGEGGCSDMVFVPERFDHQGNFWQCLNEGKYDIIKW